MKGNNTIPIGGELESVATSGVVVSADGVKDYQLNKSQETINGEQAEVNSELLGGYSAIAAGVPRSGDTRPDGSDIYVGFMFFDTSLSTPIPIYASAIDGDTVTWVDATGTEVE